MNIPASLSWKKSKRSLLSVINVITLLTLFCLLALFLGRGQSFPLVGMKMSLQTSINLLRFLLVLFLFKALLERKHYLSPEFSRFKKAGLVFILTSLVYLANNRTIWAGDTIPTGLLPISLMHEGDFDLNEFPFLYEGGGQLPHFLIKREKAYLSFYPMGASLYALPIYFLSELLGFSPLEHIDALEKVSASSAVALSAVFLFLSLSMLTEEGWAYLITFIYAFCTSSWSVSSQGLWQHGPSQLSLAASLFFLLKGKGNPRYLIPAGATVAFSLFCRPTNGIALFFILIYFVVFKREDLPYFLLLSVPLLLLLFLYNYTHYGNLVGGYHGLVTHPYFWRGSFLKTLLALLISPSRGLFFYSPIMVFSCIGGIFLIKGAKDNPLFLCLSVIPLGYLLVFSHYTVWWGGGSFGPRLLSDPLPFFSFMLVPIVERPRWKRIFKVSLFFLIPYSLFVHFLGAFSHLPHAWNETMEMNENTLWSLKNGPIVWSVAAFLSRGLPSEQGISPKNWKAQANFTQEDAPLAFDRDPDTWWSSRVPQKQGQAFFLIDLGRSEELSEALLFAGKYPQDFPRGLLVEVSLDGKEWGKACFLEKVEPRYFWTRVPFDESFSARYIKFTQMGEAEYGWPWSMGEVFLYPPDEKGKQASAQ